MTYLMRKAFSQYYHYFTRLNIEIFIYKSLLFNL